ncbi:MAG: hypothetical protein IJ317_02475 [Clostridia bacterium]|nr:hypothetical protein [Clostridia bacterium]
MNKLLTKTVKKVNLMTVIMGVVLALAIVITAIFGINYAASADSGKTLSVTVNGYFYNENKAEVETVCEDVFEKLDVSYKQYGEMSGDESEILYVFDASVTEKEMDDAETALEAAFAAKAAADADWDGAFITVSSHEEKLLVNIPLSYFMRALGGVALFTGLAFAYVSIRRKLHMGVLTAACACAAFVMTAAVICLTRIPFTTSSLYVIALAPMVATVICLFMQNKIAASLKAGENADDMQAVVVNSAATKETLAIVAVGGVALVIVGAVATISTTWFAVTALVGLLVSACVGWLFAPAAYLPIKAIADKCAANRKDYVGAKKAAKQKKISKKLAEIAVEENFNSQEQETTEE